MQQGKGHSTIVRGLKSLRQGGTKIRDKVKENVMKHSMIWFLQRAAILALQALY